MEELFLFIRQLEADPPLTNQRDWGSAPNPGVYRIGGEWLQGKRPFPGARFPSWEPIAPAELLGLLSSRALSVQEVCPAGAIGSRGARVIDPSAIKSTFAQLATAV